MISLILLGCSIFYIFTQQSKIENLEFELNNIKNILKNKGV